MEVKKQNKTGSWREDWAKKGFSKNMNYFVFVFKLIEICHKIYWKSCWKHVLPHGSKRSLTRTWIWIPFYDVCANPKDCLYKVKSHSYLYDQPFGGNVECRLEFSIIWTVVDLLEDVVEAASTHLLDFGNPEQKNPHEKNNQSWRQRVGKKLFMTICNKV